MKTTDRLDQIEQRAEAATDAVDRAEGDGRADR